MSRHDLLADAPLSYGVDLRREAALVQRYDLDKLSKRIHLEVMRRRFIDGALAGVVVTLAAMGIAGGVAHAVAGPPLQTDPAISTARVDGVEQGCSCADPDAPASAQCTGAAGAAQIVAPPAPRVVVVTRTVAAPAAPVAEANDPERSRLRQELALFDAASTAVAAGDLDGTMAATQALRARFPDGPLAVEAGILQIRALSDAHREAEAYVVLKAMRGDPRTLAKKAELDALTRALTADAADDDDDEPTTPDGALVKR